MMEVSQTQLVATTQPDMQACQTVMSHTPWISVRGSMDGWTDGLPRSVGRSAVPRAPDRPSESKKAGTNGHPRRTCTRCAPALGLPGRLGGASITGARRGRLCRWCLVCGAPVRAFGCLHCTYLLHTCSIGSRQPSSAPARRASRLAISRRVLSVCVLRCRWLWQGGRGTGLRPAGSGGSRLSTLTQRACRFNQGIRTTPTTY